MKKNSNENTIELIEDIRIPGTDIILEKGDKIEIFGRKLKEGGFDIYAYLRETYPQMIKKVSDISGELEWDIFGAMSFCLHLLEDVNAHSVFKEVEKIFQNEIKKWK